MNFQLWFQFATSLATIVAQQSGRAPRELAYLQLLTNAATLAAITDEDLTELKARYELEVASDTPTTAADLLAVAERIEARGARIQSS
ncbi:MAG TPA: hypothetical protein VGD45_20735 [Steroidobacter sp.]|uniref:hypothetical protein n=1 Tax=Steroidobacter sp. TaxID=1978227 RepID=UPI002ED8D140